METVTHPAERSFPDALITEHRELDRLLRELRDAAEADASADFDRVWSTLERGMLAHFEEEELYLFPALALEHAEEEAALASDHARFRSLLAEIGIAIELHAVRLETIDELSAAIRDHARREDALLYPWAARATAPGPRAARERARKRGQRARPSSIA